MDPLQQQQIIRINVMDTYLNITKMGKKQLIYLQQINA